MKTPEDFLGPLVPLSDHLDAASCAHRSGVCKALVYMGAWMLLLGWAFWPRGDCRVRVGRVMGGDGGGGDEIPPTMTERASEKPPPADALPN